MKKRILLLVVCLAVLLAAVFGVHSVAAAEAIPQQYVTADYYELGTIYAVSAYADSVAFLRTKDGVAYLTVLGATRADVMLTVDAASLGEVHMAYYDGKAMLSLGDALTVYDVRDGTWHRTNIPTVYESEGLMGTVRTPLVHFDVDETGRVYVGYQLTIGWLPFEDIYNDGQLFTGSTVLSQSTQNYDAFTAHNGVCMFYRTSGAMFALNTNVDPISATETVEMSAFSMADMTTQPLFLRDGLVVGNEGTVHVAGVDQAHTGDAYLRNGTALCTSRVDGAWRLWVVDNGQSAIKMYDEQMQYLGMYGAWGEADGRLQDPTQVAHDRMVVVNDSGNHRVAVLRDGVYTHFDVDAGCVATVGERVFVGEQNIVTCYDYARPSDVLPYTATIYHLPSTVLSVCADNTTVYALTADNLFLLRTESDPINTLRLEGAIRAKIGRHQGTVYVQTTDAIIFYKDMERVEATLSIGDMSVADFDVDYCGNIYLLDAAGALHLYLLGADGYTDGTADFMAGFAAFASGLFTPGAPLIALSIGADGRVYGLSRSALVVLNIPVRTRENSAYVEPQWDSPVGVVHVRNSVWGYASPNNYASMVRVPQDTYAMLMATHAYEGAEYYYVEFALSAMGAVRYEKVYIPVSDATAVGYTTPDNMYVRYDGASTTTGLYAHPSYSAAAVQTVAKAEATFEVLRVMGVEDGVVVWPWYMVRMGDATYYVAMDNYVSAQPPYVEVERYYARCVAGKLGEKVAVYAAPSTESEVVATLVDGTKVELTAPFDANSQFTCIRLDDQEVYILTDNVTTRSMTNGQTFALIMSIIVIGLAAVTLVLYLLVQRSR